MDWGPLISKKKDKKSYKLVFFSILCMKYQWIYDNLQGYCFGRVSLNEASCQTDDRTVSFYKSVELVLME